MFYWNKVDIKCLDAYQTERNRKTDRSKPSKWPDRSLTDRRKNALQTDVCPMQWIEGGVSHTFPGEDGSVRWCLRHSRCYPIYRVT